MNKNWDPKAGATAVTPPRNGKREGEDEDERQVSAKKQKRDEVAEEQKNKGEIISDRSFSDSEPDKNPETKKVLLSKREKKRKPTNANSSCSLESLADGFEDEGNMDIDEGDNSEESDEEAKEKKMEVMMDSASNAQERDLKNVETNSSSDSSDDDHDGDYDGSDFVEKPMISSEDSEEEIQEKASQTPQESPKMLVTLKEQIAASRTIVTRNLSYSVERADLENLFKECGEIVDVRLHTDHEGRFRGFGHVEFATTEAVQKALQLNSTELLRCPIRVAIAREKVKYNLNQSNWSNSFQKCGRIQHIKVTESSEYCEEEIEGNASESRWECPKTLATWKDQHTISKTICARNLSYSVERADIEILFKECGEIVDVRLSMDHEGRFKGFGHVEFTTTEAAQKGQVDFDDKNSWEYLFKDYYIDLKGKLSLSFDELTQAKNPWKGSDMLPSKEESPDELFDASNDRGSDSDSSYENADLSRSKRRKTKKRAKSRSKEGNSYSAVTMLGADGLSGDDSSEWASKELLEFVMHMRNGDKSVLSQFDVQALLLEYIKRNKLRDPRRKSQIICDARLQNLFGKPRVGHFEMLKLLESHFLLKEDSQAEDLQGSVVDTEISHLESDGDPNLYPKAGRDKRRKNRKKGNERELQSNVDDYAAIDNHNINLIYLRRNLVEDLLEDTEKFHDKVVGSFVRIRISGSGQKQDLYRLVQVVGTCKAAEPYKVGKRMTDILLEILNLNKTEIVSIDIISNQEFTEDECKRLRQSIKCGLINRLTVGDIQDKALVLQAVRVKDWLETEIVRLSHLRDRASEKGRRKELRECVEKLQLLKTPEERQRRLEEIPEIHVDPNMDPSYESEEDEDEMDDKRQESYTRPRGSAAFGRRGREIVSPRSGSISSDSWNVTRNYSNVNQELSRNLSNKGFSIKGDNSSNASEVLNDAQLHQGRDRESQLSNSWERQKLSSSMESGAKNIQSLVTSESFSTTVLEAPAAPSSAGIAPPAVKINETEKMWHYQDPSGKVQGPFSMVQLRKWSNTGYFPADLRIWRMTEKQDESILLTDALAGNFSKEPSMIDKAQSVQDLHYSSSYSRNSHGALGSPGQTTGGSWRSKDNMNSLASRTSPLAVEVPKNPANAWGSDAGVRNESTNLPSPTPQVTPGGTQGQAFENKWSPTPVQLAGSVFPGGHGGLQASVVVRPEHVVQNAEKGSSSQPGMTSASTDAAQLRPQATVMAPVLASGVDIQMAGANMQNQVVGGHNSQAWGGTSSQRIELTNPATMPAQPASHGHWGDAPSVQNTASFSTGNPTGSLPTPGFMGMTTPEPWRPPASSNQSNITAQAPANMPWGMGMPGNQNIGWGGALPANMNVNWMPGQVPAPGNTNNPGWAAPSQGLPPANAVGWGGPGPGQGRSLVNANAGWAVPGQGMAPGNANPGWGASSGNPGMWGNEQSHNGDRFPNQGDRGSHGGDSGYGGKSWNRQSSFGSGGRGGSSRPPFAGQRGVCKYHESGRCKKGASCDFLHP